MIPSQAKIYTKIAKLTCGSQQEIGIDFPESPGFLGVNPIDKTTWCRRARGLAGGVVVVVLVTRPIVLSDAALGGQPGQEVVSHRNVAKNPVAANVLKLPFQGKIRVCTVSKPRINELVAVFIECVVSQHIQRHGVG